MIVVNQTSKLLVSPDFGAECIFWWLVCYAATQLALQLQQERLQVVRSNEVVRGLLVTVCLHLGCRLRVSGICPIHFAPPLPKSPLCAYDKISFVVVRICGQKDPCVHLSKWSLWLRTLVPKKTLACIRFRNDPCVHPVFRVTKTQRLDPKIRNFGIDFRNFTTAIGFQYPTVVYEGAYNQPEPFLV